MSNATKKHVQHCKEKPEWMRLALVAVNLWGKQEHTLAHAVALALEDAYKRGTRGDCPEAAAEPQTTLATVRRRRR